MSQGNTIIEVLERLNTQSPDVPEVVVEELNAEAVTITLQLTSEFIELYPEGESNFKYGVAFEMNANLPMLIGPVTLDDDNVWWLPDIVLYGNVGIVTDTDGKKARYIRHFVESLNNLVDSDVCFPVVELEPTEED